MSYIDPMVILIKFIKGSCTSLVDVLTCLDLSRITLLAEVESAAFTYNTLLGTHCVRMPALEVYVYIYIYIYIYIYLYIYIYVCIL